MLLGKWAKTWLNIGTVWWIPSFSHSSHALACSCQEGEERHMAESIIYDIWTSFSLERNEMSAYPFGSARLFPRMLSEFSQHFPSWSLILSKFFGTKSKQTLKFNITTTPAVLTDEKWPRLGVSNFVQFCFWDLWCQIHARVLHTC